MPGVPSGRGCEACRKQKKKCNQLVPACSRCTRLGIPCVGGGQQRYKFLNQTTPVPRPSTPPSNQVSTLSSRLVFAMGVTDARFDLTVYGYFLQEIPSRLGRNPALDASVQALAVAFSCLLNRQHDSEQAEVLQSYSDAVKCLRGCLKDAASAQTSETLCAVYLVMVCQGWIGRRGDFLPSHGEAIAHLLNAAAESGTLSTSSAFETGMVATLGMVVVMESFFNPKLKLDPRLLAFPRSSGPQRTVQDAFEIASLRLGPLTRTAQLIQGASAGTSQEDLSKIRSAYHQAQKDCITLKAALSQVPWQQQQQQQQQPMSTPAPLSVQETRFHIRMQSCYGVLLALAIMLNSILQEHEANEQQQPNPNPLAQQANTYVDQVIALAQQAEQYRPLGSSGTPLYLITALSVAKDAVRQAALERLIGNYQSDFASTNWLAVAQLIKPKLQ